MSHSWQPCIHSHLEGAKIKTNEHCENKASLQPTTSSYSDETMNSTVVYVSSPINWIRVGFIEETIPSHAVAEKGLVVSHRVDIETIVTCPFSEAKDIQPGSAECYLLLYDFNPSTRVFGLFFVYRYQVFVHLFAVSGLE
jgi:hypothetical protein